MGHFKQQSVQTALDLDSELMMDSNPPSISEEGGYT